MRTNLKNCIGTLWTETMQNVHDDIMEVALGCHDDTSDGINVQTQCSKFYNSQQLFFVLYCLLL